MSATIFFWYHCSFGVESYGTLRSVPSLTLCTISRPGRSKTCLAIRTESTDLFWLQMLARALLLSGFISSRTVLILHRKEQMLADNASLAYLARPTQSLNSQPFRTARVVCVDHIAKDDIRRLRCFIFRAGAWDPAQHDAHKHARWGQRRKRPGSLHRITLKLKTNLATAHILARAHAE